MVEPDTVEPDNVDGTGGRVDVAIVVAIGRIEATFVGIEGPLSPDLEFILNPDPDTTALE